MFARNTDILHFNEKLIELVEQNASVYDTNAEGYSNAQVQDEIWRKIAGELHEDVAACKLKWKNIRTCFNRHLRQVASQKFSKTKRTYYLASKLTFLLPFCKPNSRPVSERLWSDEGILQYEDDLDPLTKAEPTEDDDESSAKMEANTTFDGNSSDGMQSNNELLLNKHLQWNTKNDFQNKRRKVEDHDEPELNFFKSLLPDLRKMDGKQKNKLKMAVLGAINDILYSDNAQTH